MSQVPPKGAHNGSSIVEIVKGISDQVQVLGKTDTSGTIVNEDGTTITVGDNSTYYQTDVIVSSVAPTGLNQSTDVATVWYDTTTDPYTIKWWDGFGFQTYVPGQAYRGGIGLDALAPAVLSRIQTNLRLYYRATAPGSPVTNWLWKDSDDNKVYRWNGTTWVEILDTNILTAVTNALTAPGVNLTDEYITVYYQASGPTSQNTTTDKGNLWFESDNSMLAYSWNGLAWVTYEGDVRDTPTGTDGVPPPYSPVPTIIPVFGGYFITFAPVPNADSTVYDIFAATTTPVPIIAANLLESTEGTFVSTYLNPAGFAYVDGAQWHFAVLARDPDGLAPVSASVAGGTVKQQIVRTQITPNAVDTPQLNANAVTASIVASNAVYTAALQADAVSTNALDSLAITAKHTLTGPVVQTAAGGERLVMRNDGSGGILESYSGLSGETPGSFNPAANAGRPAIEIKPGSTGTYTSVPFIGMYTSTANNGQLLLSASYLYVGDAFLPTKELVLAGDNIYSQANVDFSVNRIKIGNGSRILAVKLFTTTANVDGSSEITVNHGLGAQPDVVLCNPRSMNRNVVPFTLNATQVTFRCYKMDDNTALASGTSVSFVWAAFVF